MFFQGINFGLKTSISARNSYFQTYQKGGLYIAKDHVIDFLSERPEIYTFFRILWVIMQNIVNIAIGKFRHL